MFPALLILWLLFSGSLSVSAVMTGAVVSALITLFCRRFMGWRPPAMEAVGRKFGAAVGYFFFLLKEILLSNLAVLRLVYRRKLPEPVLVRFKSCLRSNGAKVLVANSITLTPGTFTVTLEGDEFCVHALDGSFSTELERCGFIQRAEKLEG